MPKSITYEQFELSAKHGKCRLCPKEWKDKKPTGFTMRSHLWNKHREYGTNPF